MKYASCLSTRTERCCPQCGGDFVLVEPTDVLAQRPVQVDLVCDTCHFPGRATLTDEHRFRTVMPSPSAVNVMPGLDPARSWLAGPLRSAGVRRPSSPPELLN